jgi:hypothetical protein
MSENKKPPRLIAILITVGAVCNLLISLLMVAGGKYSGKLLTFQLFTTLLLVIAAIGNWYQFSKQYVDFEVKRRLKEGASEQQD